MSPELATHPLYRADGSATFASKLFSVTAAANGPVEVQRRDELPEEAAIEVNVRPSSGVGGPRERWMESVLTSLLRSLLLVHMHPRTLMQVTLQITKQPSIRLKRAVLDVSILPTLANAALLALVDGGIPLGKTMVASLAAVAGDGKVMVDPAEKQLVGCKSVHAMAYSMKEELLLNQSVGSFGVEEWQEIAEQLKATTASAMGATSDDHAMEDGITQEPWLRQAFEESVRKAGSWRNDT
jgi:exosome complex component RRP46